jgi:hypothetical protein
MAARLLSLPAEANGSVGLKRLSFFVPGSYWLHASSFKEAHRPAGASCLLSSVMAAFVKVAVPCRARSAWLCHGDSPTSRTICRRNDGDVPRIPKPSCCSPERSQAGRHGPQRIYQTGTSRPRRRKTKPSPSTSFPCVLLPALQDSGLNARGSAKRKNSCIITYI